MYNQVLLGMFSFVGSNWTKHHEDDRFGIFTWLLCAWLIDKYITYLTAQIYAKNHVPCTKK